MIIAFLLRFELFLYDGAPKKRTVALLFYITLRSDAIMAKGSYLHVTVGHISTYTTDPVYQYDRGIFLQISGLNANNVTFHFATSTSSISISQDPQIVSENQWTVAIPDVLLSKSEDIICYVYVEDETSGFTVYKITIPIIPRQVNGIVKTIKLDTTLTKSEYAAESKAVGDRFSKVESKLITSEEKLLLLELLKTAVYQTNTANQNYNKLLSAWQKDVSTLADARPQIVSVTPDKTSIVVGESVTFTVVQKNAQIIRFIVDEQVNERIYDVTQETISFSKTFISAGDRIIAFQAVDNDGNLGLESTRITISVKES